MPGMVEQQQSRTPEIARTVVDLRRLVSSWRRAGERVGLVPTMGALHIGHIALVAALRDRVDRVVASVFVNPTQFAPNEDFAAYPRNEEVDLAKLAAIGIDAVFAPPTAEMYPAGFATSVLVAGPAQGLESDSRPHFFGGVATVVSKLLLACLPDVAVFGEKDYQQLLVIKRMTADLTIPVEILGHPTLREDDGLALSSRNAYLSSQQRLAAPLLYRSLGQAAAAIRGGAQPSAALHQARASLTGGGFEVDYVELRNADSLAPVANLFSEPLRLLAAARLGRTRLIDNITV